MNDAALHAGPGFSVAFSAGNCTFDPEQLLSPDGAIQCVGPSVTLDQTPSFLTLGYQGAASLQGQVRLVTGCFLRGVRHQRG